MSRLTLILRSLFHHWRINASVAMGVAAATAVLTGALLVGDSMRGSLRQLTLDRLGHIDHVLLTERFFRAELAEEVAAMDRFDDEFTAALPVILLHTTLEHTESKRRASQVTTLGIDDQFWQLDPERVYGTPGYDDVVLNQKLADELGVEAVGEEVLLRVARASQIPADSPLGRKVDDTPPRRLTVSHILPNEGLGRFSMQSSQQTPLVAYVNRRALQGRSVLDQKGKVNAIILAGKSRGEAASGEATAALADSLRPKLEDYGISVEPVMFEETGGTAPGYVNIASDQMVLPPYVADLVMEEFQAEGAQPAITYLANWIRTPDDAAKVPYSTITAIDSTKALGPLLHKDGRAMSLAGDQIVLSGWTADDMAAQGREVVVGDRIELVFFEPESTHGEAREQSATFLFGSIAPTAAPDAKPTPATDSHFTPEVPGLTDQESIDDWDPPFPYYAERVRSVPPNNQDDAYWKAYKATPKAFISYEKGKELWDSRFGAITTIRVPLKQSDENEAALAAGRLRERIEPEQLGFTFRPVKRQALEASSGTTPFAGLFIGFSFFIIAAAVMLVALLFQLGIQQRSSQVGVMLAVGLQRKLTGRLLSREGLTVALIGGMLGVGLGIAYARLMIAGLNSPSWWGQAIATPFLSLHLDNPVTYIVGLLSGVVIAWLTILFCVSQMRRLPIRSLMAGKTVEGESIGAASRRRFPLAETVAVVLLATAVGLLFYAQSLSGEAQAGAFFGGGAAILTAILLFLWALLRRGGSSAAIATGGWPLLRLALRNAGRNPGRSTLTIGLVASATFLIVAISAFRLDPNQQGTGGFDVLAESTQPILYDLNDPDARRDKYRIGGDAEAALSQAQLVALRVKGGDDASCLNLYQSQQPRILGVSQSMVDYFDDESEAGFAWAGTAAETPDEEANPWTLLSKTYEDTPDAIPVVIDKNTAMYSLHLYGGMGSTFEITDDDGRQIELRIVGLLANSILQGSLLISDEHFKQLYPAISGYRMFLAKNLAENPKVERIANAPEGSRTGSEPSGAATSTLINALESSLSEQGMDAVDSRLRLRDLLAVQNTYLSTFQSLGALGLLLGTFGLATVQLRSVLERRGELALMRSTGFRRGRLAQMVMLENIVLLIGGLGAGIDAAIVTVLPHWLAGGASIPWGELALYLGIVLVVGIFSGLIAVLATLRAPLLGALRGS